MFCLVFVEHLWFHVSTCINKMSHDGFERHWVQDEERSIESFPHTKQVLTTYISYCLIGQIIILLLKWWWWSSDGVGGGEVFITFSKVAEWCFLALQLRLQLKYYKLKVKLAFCLCGAIMHGSIPIFVAFLCWQLAKEHSTDSTVQADCTCWGCFDWVTMHT